MEVAGVDAYDGDDGAVDREGTPEDGGGGVEGAAPEAIADDGDGAVCCGDVNRCAGWAGRAVV